MNSDMKGVQTCAESNTEGSMFIEESFFCAIRPNKTHHYLRIENRNQQQNILNISTLEAFMDTIFSTNI